MSGKKLLVFTSLVAVLIACAVGVALFSVTTCLASGGCKEKATGHGTLTLSDGTKRQFSFNAIRDADGTAKGNAVIHNKSFDFRGHIEVTCLSVQGNRARIAGVVKGTNDPNLDDNTAVFEVFDNGEPGRGNDTISLVFFSPPNSPPPNQAYCEVFEGLPQMPIDGGNIQVNDCP
ncbi:MAG: hypothetical protein M3033_18580 [Acidobacteriota bacterium]|nr:hypothetical protein [Acidobacteriota bacterium]